DLKGDEKDRPALFWVRSSKELKPVVVDQMTAQEILALIKPNFPTITLEEAQQLKDKKPFSFDTLAKSERNADIFEAALKSGVLGVQYFVTNIKRFSENSPAAYIQFMTDFVEKYNGYAQVLLSVEESPKVLAGDGSGMFSAIDAIASVLGDDFIKSVSLNIITDGGTKSRGGNWTGKIGYSGDMPTAFGIRYYDRAFRVLGQVRLQHKDYGKGRVYWTASDGDYDIGDMTVGDKLESQLENDGSWNVMIHGVEEAVFPENQQEEIFAVIKKVAEANPGLVDKIRQNDDKESVVLFEKALVASNNPDVDAALALIRKLKLEHLGENFANAKTGALEKFWEKPSPVLILLLLQDFQTNRIIPNAFLVVYTIEAFMAQQLAARAATVDGKPLRTDGGSYFEKVFQAQFNSSVMDKVKPQDGKIGYKAIMDTMPADQGKILAGGLGKVGRFTDRGKTVFLNGAYFDAVKAEKANGNKGLITRGTVNIASNVKVNLPEGATVVLENVRIESDTTEPVELTFTGNNYIQNSRIIVNSNEELSQIRIVESDIGIKLNNGASSKDVVLLGVMARPGMKTQDIMSNGRWESIDEKGLDLAPGETIVSVLTIQGQRYIHRTLDGDYKGKSLTSIINNDFKGRAITNPRLIGIQGVSDEQNGDVELIKMKNWRHDNGNDVNIDGAKESLHYLKMYQERNVLMALVSNGVVLNGEAQKVTKDNAEYGGIDFNPAALNLVVERTGQGIKVQVDPAEIQRIKTEGVVGFTPIIVNITPIKTMFPVSAGG
ncbi:MAG: hypothetical protein V2A70_03095, partial [Candidatus Omnitrophota bacterium]